MVLPQKGYLPSQTAIQEVFRIFAGINGTDEVSDLQHIDGKKEAGEEIFCCTD